MAEPIKYFPEADETHQTARDELDALLETLHTSGTLRALDGFFGRFSEVTEVAVTQLNGPPGRKLLGNLAVLAKALTESEPKALERVMSGVVQALSALEQVGRARPAGIFALLRLMHDADTRRGFYALTQVLRAIGASLDRAAEQAPAHKPLPVVERGESRPGMLKPVTAT